MNWIPIAERLPEKEGYYVWWCPNINDYCIVFRHLNKPFTLSQFTHWLEITGPEEKSKCEKCIFHERYGCSTMTLLKPSKDNPFRRAKLRVVDFSHSDNCYVLEEPEEEFCEWEELDACWLKSKHHESIQVELKENIRDDKSFCPHCGRKITTK